MATSGYGARTPSAQGSQGQYGAASPGTNAGNPASQAQPRPAAPRSTVRPSPSPAGDQAPGGGSAPPHVQQPSVNRDGTIPPPAPPPAPAPAPRPTAYGGNNMSSGERTLEYWAQQGVGHGQIFDENGQMKPGWKRTANGYERDEAPPPPPGGGGGGGGEMNHTMGMPQPMDFGPLADSEWNAFVKQNLAPKALHQGQLQAYQASQAPLYQDPSDPRITSAHNDLMLKALQNPESMSPQVVAAMKEEQKEAALGMRQQLMGQNAQSAISRGTFGGWYMGSRNRDVTDLAISDMTRAYRDIDINAAKTNFADRLSTLGAADQMQTGVASRAQGNYQTGLMGRGFNADENWRANQSVNDGTKFNYERSLAEANLQNQAVQNALQAWSTQTQENLGRHGLSLDWARFGEGSMMGRLGYGLDLARLELDGQNSMMDRIWPRG
jgi:hypothetical protein